MTVDIYDVQRTALCSDVAYSFRLLAPSLNLSADALWHFGNQDGHDMCCCCCLLACRDFRLDCPQTITTRRTQTRAIIAVLAVRVKHGSQDNFLVPSERRNARWLTCCRRSCHVFAFILRWTWVLEILIRTKLGEKLLWESSLLSVQTVIR